MFPCPICDLKLNSLEQRKAHCRGKNHIKREQARKKAEELGTDFDSTPDHCDVCNVPLTSKMTAIDHFKGKMHQKKVKAVEDQRLGFRNYCDICEVRLQSLKVSEAHFNGKQHRKRERKNIPGRGFEKKISSDRNFSEPHRSRPQRRDFSPAQNIVDVGFKDLFSNSSTWEAATCPTETEPKDPLGEFRNTLSVRSLTSPPTPRTSSSNQLKDFSFDSNGVSHDASIGPVKTSANSNTLFAHREIFSAKPRVLQPSVIEAAVPANVLFKSQLAELSSNATKIPGDKTPLEFKSGLRSESQAKNTTSYLSKTCKLNKPASFTSRHPPKDTNGVTARQGNVVRYRNAVLYVLSEAAKPLSSGDIAVNIAELSPSDVNLILGDLEKSSLVSKSGYAPILWSLEASLFSTFKPEKPRNGFFHPNGKPQSSYTEAQIFQTSCLSYGSQKNSNQMFSSSETFSPAILHSTRSTYTTNTTPCEKVSPCLIPRVVESNLINLFQQSGPLTLPEVKVKLGFQEDGRLRVFLDKLVERRVLAKDGGKNERWRLAILTRSNSVGVIGEERKRRSPVQGGELPTDYIGRRTPSPPKDNTCGSIHNGCLTHEVDSKTLLAKNGYSSLEKPNGLFEESRNCSKTLIPYKFAESTTNGHHDLAFPTNQPIVCDKNSQIENYIAAHSPSPPLPSPLKTETSELLDGLTATSPKPYQKELYEMAMQEDVVCYLPCGTGKDLVMAQVIGHMAVLNLAKQALVIVSDVVSALERAKFLRKELAPKCKPKKLNIALFAGQLKQSNGRAQVAVVTASTCLSLLNCGALTWRDVCLLVFDRAAMCYDDESSRKILHDYYFKAKMDFRDGHVPKLLSFIDSSAGEKTLEETVTKLGNILANMGDIFLSCVRESVAELDESKREAMFVCVQTAFSQTEADMFLLLGTYLNLVFDNLAAQWQPFNSYRELLKICFKETTVNSEAFAKLIRVTGYPLEKRLPLSCLKTWRHYLAICEVIFALAECGVDIAKELLVSLKREPFGFSWANDVGLPGYELSLQLIPNDMLNWGSTLYEPRGSGLRELLEQLMIVQWENARVSSERPLALVVVKVNKTARALANYLARCPELTKRNVRTTFVDGSRTSQQKAVIAAIKRRQYQVIVSTDSIEDNLDLPHCELVVLLDQPTPVSALEELRVRNATNVVAICREAGGEETLKALLKKEELVEKSIAVIRGYDR